MLVLGTWDVLNFKRIKYFTSLSVPLNKGRKITNKIICCANLRLSDLKYGRKRTISIGSQKNIFCCKMNTFFPGEKREGVYFLSKNDIFSYCSTRVGNFFCTERLFCTFLLNILNYCKHAASVFQIFPKFKTRRNFDWYHRRTKKIQALHDITDIKKFTL